MRAIHFVTFAFLAGCASSLETVQTVRESAPEWYEARKVEFRGEGYPSIAEVPFLSAEARPGRGLPISEAETLAALSMFRNDPRAALPEETPEEMWAWAQEVRLSVEAQIPPADFMTNEEVLELKAIFDTPRGRL